MTMHGAKRVYIQEVAPRDGLQIEPRFVETADKIALINALSRTGVAKIEVSSFVSPAAIPNLSDASDVFASIRRCPNVIYVALVPNMRGAERALAAHPDEVNLVLSASETHNLANMRMTREASLAQFKSVCDFLSGSGIRLHATVATAFGCPFEGPQDEKGILAIIERYRRMGIGSVTLADTTGMADPRLVHQRVTRVLAEQQGIELTLHFHDTRGMGLANVLAAWDAGAFRFDAALGGVGGCPFAPGASGNICTEDTVHMFAQMGVETGVDLSGLISLSRGFEKILGHELPGHIAKAGRACDLHPAPASLSLRAGN